MRAIGTLGGECSVVLVCSNTEYKRACIQYGSARACKSAAWAASAAT